MSGISRRKCCCDPCSNCVVGTCQYRVSIAASWLLSAGTAGTLTAYGKVDASATVWFGNTPAGGLKHSPSTGCSGATCFDSVVEGNSPSDVTRFTAGHTFRGWYNQRNNTFSPVTPISADITVVNTGTGTICVNGQNVAPGCLWTAPIANAGYNNGNQDAYGSGTVVVVTAGCCP